jgi:two-component system NtrC family response regulator/two-component system response regulator AtoC
MTEENARPIHLLIADDEEDLVTFLAHRLRKRGIEVAMAFSGSEAVSAASEMKLDVAIVDLKMPDMDGITVIERLKELQPFVEVVMLTGHGSHDSAWEAGRLQAFRYVLKPYDFEELYEVILTAAKHRREKMQHEFEEKLNDLMAGTTSPRDLIEESEKLRSEYEQD